MTATGDQLVPREERVLLAVRAYQQGQFESTRKAAAAYDVLNRQYLIDCARLPWYNGSCRWTSEDAADSGLHSSDGQLIAIRARQRSCRENWVRKFVGRHGEIKAKYSRRYDYQRAKCEDPKDPRMVRSSRGDETEMGILDEDVYNFDETGFQMGVAATARVLTGLTGEVGQYSRSLEIANGLL
ncbi:uncharacterized protein HRG_10912 [Hirsutella rhossiliensis]|uniref:Uncharacterized protein n=1 Tax=Hirsutella rhossiliensis TaxID=111463 RepID=A0A9P8MMN1_9HYPO|nr:uncharacterized protein HRG_10912 [Hirsutella rhossiliensis]KAH0957819.1 hypothetical protein HRG_10912 [Hirsutella rhossiliensis]